MLHGHLGCAGAVVLDGNNSAETCDVLVAEDGVLETESLILVVNAFVCGGKRVGEAIHLFVGVVVGAGNGLESFSKRICDVALGHLRKCFGGFHVRAHVPGEVATVVVLSGTVYRDHLHATKVPGSEISHNSAGHLLRTENLSTGHRSQNSDKFDHK